MNQPEVFPPNLLCRITIAQFKEPNIQGNDVGIGIEGDIETISQLLGVLESAKPQLLAWFQQKVMQRAQEQARDGILIPNGQADVNRVAMQLDSLGRKKPK